MADETTTDAPDIRFRLEELASSVGVGVDTIRYYQARGLLQRPTREGRIGWYSEQHRTRLVRVRDLASQGFSLAQIGELVETESGDVDALLDELAQRSVAEPGLDRAALAARSGMDRELVDLAIDAGLLSPVQGDERELFAADAVEMLTAGRELLDAGFPIEDLASLAVGHAQHVESLVDQAIELVRRRSDASGADRDELTEHVRHLVPAVTLLVARHFERTLLERALDRVEAEG